jgi:hypothetical protein
MSELTSSQVAFEESQAFRQPLLWIPLAVLFVAVVGVQAYFAGARAERGGQWTGLILSFCIMTVVYFLLFVSRLDVKVSPEGLLTRFFPLERSFRKTGWEDIVSCKIVTIRPMRFGGLGLRLTRNGKAYIVSGNRAVEVRLKNGRTLFVGTQKPDLLLAALEHR